MLALVLALPGPRQAIASWLGLVGVDIALTPSPSAPTVDTELGLQLGEQVALPELQRRVTFPIRLPTEAAEPTEFYYSEHASGGLASIVWRASPELPALTAEHPSVGMVVTQFLAAFDDPAIISKQVSPEGLQMVTVGDAPGYWLESGHVVTFRLLDAEGRALRESPRLAGNVLLWESDTAVIRMETRLSLPEALQLARSFP